MAVPGAFTQQLTYQSLIHTISKVLFLLTQVASLEFGPLRLPTIPSLPAAADS
jgi:hypothetical protein